MIDGKIPLIVSLVCRWYIYQYKVQLVGETTKFRVFHRNLLFPLTMRNESDKKQQDMEEKEPEITESEEENDTSSVEHR